MLVSTKEKNSTIMRNKYSNLINEYSNLNWSLNTEIWIVVLPKIEIGRRSFKRTTETELIYFPSNLITWFTFVLIFLLPNSIMQNFLPNSTTRPGPSQERSNLLRFKWFLIKTLSPISKFLTIRFLFR